MIETSLKQRTRPIRWLVFLFVWGAHGNPLLGQDVDRTSRLPLDAIVNARFEDVEARITSANLSQTEASYVRMHGRATAFVVTASASYASQFWEAANQYSIDRSETSELRARLLQAELAFHRAVVRARSEQYIRSAFDVRSAYDQYQAILADDPDHVDAMMRLGTIEMMLSNLPDILRSLLRIVGINSDVNVAVERIEYAISADPEHIAEYVALYALIDQMVFDFRLGSERHLTRIYEAYPESPILGAILINTLRRQQRVDEAMQIADTVTELHEAPDLVPMFALELAELAYVTEAFEDGVLRYESYLKVAGSGAKALPLLRLATCLEMLDNPRATAVYAQINGREAFDSDVFAERVSVRRRSTGMLPIERALLLASLAYDRGDYPRARQRLDQIVTDEAEPHFRAEKTYRLALLAEQAGNLIEAQRLYEQAARTSDQDSYRWGPWGWYHSARLLESQGHYQRARSHLQHAEDWEVRYDYEQTLKRHITILATTLSQAR